MKSCEYISFEVYYIDSISTKKLTGRCKNDVFIIEINLASILHGVVIFSTSSMQNVVHLLYVMSKKKNVLL